MRIRQAIAALMILLSLSAQARTAFACGMMPGASLAHCCCPAQGRDQCPPNSGSQHCCDEVAPADAPFSHAAVASDDRLHPIGSLDLPPAPAFHVLPALFNAGGGSYIPPLLDAGPYPALPLYLQTARLRL